MPATAPRVLQRDSTDDRGRGDYCYWLRNADGFRVDSPAGPLGIVEEVRVREPFGEPATLVVRAGRLGRRALLVPAWQVDAVVPRDRRLVLRATPTVVGTEPLTSRPRRRRPRVADSSGLPT